MSVYAVSYDLKKPGSHYQPLWDRLADWKAVRALESFWLIDSDDAALVIRDDLKKYVDSNDGLFVGRLAGETSWHKVKPGSDQFLWKRFGSA